MYLGKGCLEHKSSTSKAHASVYAQMCMIFEHAVAGSVLETLHLPAPCCLMSHCVMHGMAMAASLLQGSFVFLSCFVAGCCRAVK